MSSIEKQKSIFSLEKKETIRKIRRKYFPLIAIGCITIQVSIAASYLDHNYPIDLTLLISSGCLLLVAAYFSFYINKNVNKEKFYMFFLYFPFVLIFLSVNLSLFKRELVSEFLNICFGYIILSVTIIAVNASINRFFFSSGELGKTENKEKSVSDLANSKSSDEVENQKQTASLNDKNAVRKKIFRYIKKEQTVDEISSEFAVDVLSIALFFGIIFGAIAYLLFVPNKDIALFFGGIDVKTVALATAGLVTFFWGAKAAKNKSIELEEKKQDGKRRDKEIKMAEARDTAQLIAKASELLGSESDAQKNAGLAFLNTVASQNGGPLQKEAFDLLADFILSATDTTTANNPRMRAIIYVDDLLEESCRHFAIYEFIVISASDGAEPSDAINNLNSLRIKNLYITYIGLAFGARAIHWATHSKNDYQFSFVSCKLDGRRISEPPEIIKNILVTNCYINNFQIFYICNIFKNSLVQVHNSVTKEFKFVNAIPKKYLPKNEKSINRFLECDFSSSKNWKDTRSNIEEGQEKDRFDRCFYYAGHPPYGFGEEGDDALLTEISSEQQFDELIDDPFLMKYSPPDDKKNAK